MDLTYKRTIELIQASASAEKNAKTMLAPGTVLHIPQTTTASASRRPSSRKASFNCSQGQPRDCYRCGGKHNLYECKFKEATCHFCKVLGHIRQNKPAHQRRGPPTEWVERIALIRRTEGSIPSGKEELTTRRGRVVYKRSPTTN